MGVRTLHTFLLLLNSVHFLKDYQNISYMMYLTFIFGRCNRSWAAVTPVKYKCDWIDIFAKIELSLISTLRNASLVIPPRRSQFIVDNIQTTFRSINPVFSGLGHSANYANPVYGVATICHQVDCLRWGHPSLFPTATMMTSSNGTIFRVTGHLCGEFTGLRWIPRTKASDAELWCFIWSATE